MRFGNAHLVIATAVTMLVAGAGPFAAPADYRLADAVKHRDVGEVRALLKGKVDVNAPMPDGATALQWAAQWDDLEIADLLLVAHAEVNAKDVYGVTPLSLATTNGSAAMVSRLLRAGADPNLALPSGETPLMTAARSGKVDAVSPLLERGAALEAKESSRGQTAVMWASAEGHTAVVKLLMDKGADIKAKSRSGFTAIHFSAQRGDRATTELLLAAGANVNEPAANGMTPLVLAVAGNFIPYAEYLVDKGADPRLGPGYTPLHLAAGTEGHVEGAEGEEDGGGEGGGMWGPPKQAFIKLLLAHGADVNAKAQRAPKGVGTAGATPFFLAAWASDPDTMRLLVANGADPKTATPQGITPLMAAAGVLRQAGGPNVSEDRALEAVKLCVEWGNDVKAISPAFGDTALHGAAYRGMHGGARITRFLVDRGADVNIVNKRGWTPLMVAEGLYFSTYNTTNNETAKVLRDAGAKATPPGFITNTGIRSSEVWYAPGCEPATLGSEGKCKP
jgi:ankyrin repeat protein